MADLNGQPARQAPRAAAQADVAQADILQGYLPPWQTKNEYPFGASRYLFALLVALNSARDAELERLLEGHGLSLIQYRSLLMVRRLGSCAMNELAVMVGADRTTLTRVIDRLSATGLVARHGDAHDRRRVLLAVTHSGLSRLKDAEEAVASLGLRAVAALSEQELRGTIAAVETLFTAFGGARDEIANVLRATAERGADSANGEAP